jgi:hypothetical protein
VSGFLSSRRNWVLPLPQANVALPPFGFRGQTYSLAGEGNGNQILTKRQDTLVLYVYYNPSTFSRNKVLRAILILTCFAAVETLLRR